MGLHPWTGGFGMIERLIAVIALAGVAFVGLAVTGTLPLPPPTGGFAAQYC